MDKRIYLLLSVFVVVALVLSACAKETPTPEPVEEPAPAEEPVEAPAGLSGKVLWWGLAEYNFDQQWQTVVDAYNEKEPNVQVDVEVFPEDAWGEKIAATLIAGGEGAPDVFITMGIPLTQFPDLLLELTPYIERDGVDTSAYEQKAWELSKVDGKVYGLPRSVHGSEGYFYNKDLFDQFGVPYPENDWTWEDALALAQQLTDKENRYYGTAVQPWWLEYDRLGFRIIAPDRSTVVGYMDSQAAIDGMTILKELYDCCSPTFAQQESEFQDVTGGGVGPSGAFLSGRTAIAQLDMGVHQQLTDAGINWGYAPAPLPDDPERRYTPGRGYVVWSVNKNSENVEAAWDFMMWMATSEEGSTLMAAAGYPVPYPDSMTMGGYPKQIVDVYFTPPDPAWQPQIIMPWDHPCGWDGAIGPFMSNTLPEILDSPADQVAEILHRGAVDAQAAWDACVELLEAGE